jgi:hypothetical protein
MHACIALMLARCVAISQWKGGVCGCDGGKAVEEGASKVTLVEEHVFRSRQDTSTTRAHRKMPLKKTPQGMWNLVYPHAQVFRASQRLQPHKAVSRTTPRRVETIGRLGCPLCARNVYVHPCDSHFPSTVL